MIRAEAVKGSAATHYVGPAWKRKLRSLVQLVRSDRRRLFAMLTGSSAQWVVFRQDTTVAPSLVSKPPDDQFEMLSEEEVRHVENATDDPEFRNRQVERLHRFGKSYAYVVRLGSSIAHLFVVIA